MHPAIVRHTDIGRGAADIEGDDAGMADRTTSTMWRAASRWRCSCARARRRRAPRSAPSSSTWCAASAGTGRAPGSPSGETATTDGPRPWPGARTTASTTSSAWPATACCTASHTRSPTTSGGAAPRPARAGCGASPRSPTPPGPGAASAGSSPGWRQARAASTPATSSPRSAETPAIPMKIFTAKIFTAPRPGREPHQAAQGPARLGPDLLPEPDRQPVPPRPAHRGLLADARPARCRAPRDAVPCAMPCPAGCRSPGPSSQPSERTCSRSAPALSRKPALSLPKGPPASASTSLRPVRMPPCSACWPGVSPPRAPDRRGAVPREPEPVQPQTQTPPPSNPGTARRRTQTCVHTKSTDKLRLR